MSSQAFFWMNVSCALILIILFFVGKRGLPAPSKLNLRKGGFGNFKSRSDSKEKSPVVHKTKKPEVHFQAESSEPGARVTKNLNVVFMYNGHTFDAFEVLGAPAGASVETAEKYLNQALARNDSDQEFLKTALSAIKFDQRK